MIQINDRVRIDLDPYQWIVYIWHNNPKKPENSRWRATSYHRTLSQAAHWIIHQNLTDTVHHEVSALEQALADSTEAITKAIRKAGIPESWKDANKKLATRKREAA